MLVLCVCLLVIDFVSESTDRSAYPLECDNVENVETTFTTFLCTKRFMIFPSLCACKCSFVLLFSTITLFSTFNASSPSLFTNNANPKAPRPISLTLFIGMTASPPTHTASSYTITLFLLLLLKPPLLLRRRFFLLGGEKDFVRIIFGFSIF